METGAEAPSSAVFRCLMYQTLRNFTACLMERDTLKDHEIVLGPQFRPGDENAPLDGGYDPSEGDATSKIVGVEVKTLVIHCRQYPHVASKSGSRWEGYIRCSEEQIKSDVLSIPFPLLRNAKSWRAIIINPKSQKRYGKWIKVNLNNTWRLRFLESTAGTKIENVVPPPLWPSMIPARSAPSALRELAHGKHDQCSVKLDDGRQIIIDEPLNNRKHSVSSLENRQLETQKRLLKYLQKSLTAVPDAQFEAIESSFTPYNADFVFKHRSGALVLVEMKLGLCAVTEEKEEESVVVVAHQGANPGKNQRPIFTHTSGRWSHMATSCGMRQICVPGIGSVPRYLLLFHRLETPPSWWYGTGDSHGVLEGEFDLSCLIDLAQSPGEKLSSLLHQDLARGRFQLPPLEHLGCLTQAQLDSHHGLYSRAADFVRIPTAPEYTAMNARRPNYVHQAQAALAWMQSCRDARQGQIYDWQYHWQPLRAYAFTFHDWTQDDLAYSLNHSRRPPVQMFEYASTKRFLFLSFCVHRQHPDEDTIYVHPFVTNGLQEHYRGTFFHESGILIVAAQNSLASCIEAPIYAIPAKAIRHEPRKANWSRYQPLRLSSPDHVEDYRFESQKSFINHLLSTLSEDGSSVMLGKHEIVLAERQGIYTAISENQKQDPIQDDKEIMGGECETDYDATQANVELMMF